MERLAGRYELLRTLGHGGMGEVHLARDLATGKECALKRLAHQPQARFNDLRREFEALSRTRHPAIVAVYDLGLGPDGVPFYTMEYVPGLTADRVLERGDWRSFLTVAIELAHGLEALHAAGIVHGDLKPSNVLVIPGATGALPSGVRLLDFGLARLLEEPGQGHRGTPGYAPPEVVSGEPPTPASDLYGLGATLYHLIAGRPAFQGSSLESVLRLQRAEPPNATVIEESGAPPALVSLLLRLMALDPAERPLAREVRLELESLDPSLVPPFAARLRDSRTAGRERELAWVERRLARRTTRPRVLVIEGEAGIGKSTLLREVARRRSLEDGAVVIPLAAGELTGGGARALARCIAAAAGADFDEGAGAADAETASTGEEEIGRLVAATIEWLRAIATRGRQVTILIDDAERLDAPTRRFLHLLLLHRESPAACWVIALAPHDHAESADFRVLIDAGIAQRARLGPLDRDGLEQLIAARLRMPAPEPLVDLLWERGSGHPGLTVEWMIQAAAGGVLSERAGEISWNAERWSEAPVPVDFMASLAARHDRLPEPARRALAALAVRQSPLAPEALGALEPAADRSAVGALIEAGIVTATTGGDLALVSPAWVDLALARLEPADALRLHRAALVLPDLDPVARFRHLRAAGEPAAALGAAEAAFTSESDPSLAVHAAEVAEGVDAVSAARWHERAGEALLAAGRYPAALDHLRRAVELDPSPARGASRMERLATVSLRAGSPVEAGVVIGKALAQELAPALRARFLARDGMRFQLIGDFDRARERGEEALALATTAEDAAARGLAAHALAYTHISSGRADQAEAMAALALESYQACDDRVGVVRARAAHAAAEHARQRLGEAEKAYDAALAAARALGSRPLIQELLVNLGVVLAESGRWERLRETHAEALRWALTDPSPRAAAVATANMAQADGLTGRPRSAVRQARAAIRLARAHRPGSECAGWRALAQAWRVQGRFGRAARAARTALELAIRSGSNDEVEWARVEVARVSAAAGRWSEVAAACRVALAEPRSGPANARAVIAALAARAAFRTDDEAAAASHLEMADALLFGRVAPYPQALVEQARAELAFHRGLSTEATAGARRTLEMLRAFPAPPDRAMAALDFARLALRSPVSDPAPAGEWLELAAAGFERLGNRRGREQALAHQVQWLKRSGSTGRVGLRDRDLLESVSRLLHSLSDLRELTARAMRMVTEQLDAERGVLLLLDAEGGRLQPIAEVGAIDAGTRREAVGFSRRVVKRVTDSGGSLLIGDAPSEPSSMSESMVNLQLRSIVCVPMYLGGKVVGAVYLDDSRRAQAFSDDDRALLEGFSHLMAVAIDRCRGQVEVERANELLVGENLSLRHEAATRFQAHRLVGSSSEMQRILPVIERAALSSSTVLITGENGTGKELIARILHHGGKRRLRPFVAVNCGAIPETLLESELFGILPNVATGVRGREGRFQQADGGSLFLDEVGDMPLGQQVALLAALANREITPVGGGNPIPVDVRIIAATNRDLRQLVEQGAFREDLFYRLHVIPVEVPPLRDRKADIPSLAHHFTAHFARLQERETPELSAEFLAVLMQSDWAGNVRELQNYIERVMAMNPGRVLYPNPPPRDLEERNARVRGGRGGRLSDLVEDLERRMVVEALQRFEGNQSRAARELGLPEQAIRYRIRKYGIHVVRENKRVRLNWRMRSNG